MRDIAGLPIGGPKRVGNDVALAFYLERRSRERVGLNSFELFKASSVDQPIGADDLDSEMLGERVSLESFGTAETEFLTQAHGLALCIGLEPAGQGHSSPASTRRWSSLFMSDRRLASRSGTPGRITDAARRWHATKERGL